MTVTGSLDGAPETARQFWIGYTAQPGYVISNPGAAPTHIDFYNGDYVRDCVSTATGDVTWDYQGIVTGTVSFNANATGGSLDYQNSNGLWLHGVVTSYRQIDAHTAVFAGTITDGSPDYTVNHPTAPTTSSPRLSTAARPAATAIRSRCSRTKAPPTASGDYDMSQGAGIVTGGNLVVH